MAYTQILASKLWILQFLFSGQWMYATGEDNRGFCPKNCTCRGTAYNAQVDCSARNLTALPPGLSIHTTHLDLSMNNLTKLQPDTFRRFSQLFELRLAANSLEDLPPGVFNGLGKLQQLHLQENRFRKIPNEALKGLHSLKSLHFDTNRISEVPYDSFDDLTSLTQLWLDGNQLKEVPVKSLNRLPHLQAVTLALNEITSIPEYAFINMTFLGVLLIYDNKIMHMHDHAFEGLNRLKILEMDRNLLTEIPVALSSLSELEELSIADNEIEYLPDDSFIGNKKLTRLKLKNNPIMSVGKYAFANLPKLENLLLSEARDQEEFLDLTGTHALEMLSVDRGSIKFIPEDLCQKVGRLKVFDIHSNHLTRIPDLSECHALRILNLGNNGLTSLEGQPFKGLKTLRDLTLSHNNIQSVPADAFEGLVNLQYLDLQHNKISEIDTNSFSPLKNIEDLNLGENHFSELPTKGLENLKNLKTFNNKELKDFPPPEKFPRIQILTLSYAYHCCEFIRTEEEDQNNKIELQEDITWLTKDSDNAFWRNLTNIWGPLENLSTSYQSFAEDVWDAFGKDYDIPYPENIPSSAANYFSEYKPKYDTEDFFIARPQVVCKPMPGPFMPCDDLMGWWSLRCGVWIVFLLALLGNGCVLFVSILSRSKMDVPRFLICNLACADFFMGIYLGFLAIVDASTLGEFKMHAIKWQTSAGCLMAGFLGVLSSELSVFTLTVITMERFYAITHAMHLNKRLSIRHAGYIMACGWFLALLLASMPLFGVSDYRKFAICLPFEIGDSVSLGYVIFIMMINCTAFGIIVSCYMKMYCSIRGSQAWNSNDTRVAKRMALLVFTDFACWAPISFFSLTAAFGYELISLNDAKVFTIFVLPLNSCANPFLYAIFTKQFKKDCGIICKRLEESAMSRSLSRLSNRNLSLSWGSSRRPSALNSFFSPDKRQSRSNSISGASAGHLDGTNNFDSSGRRSSSNSGFIKRCVDEREHMINVPIVMRNPCLCSCISSKSTTSIPTNMTCHNNIHMTINSNAKNLMDSDDIIMHRPRGEMALRMEGRGAPVGAGAGFLSLLKRKKGIDTVGDGMDSDQEDGVWVRRESLQDHLGVFPLIPLGESPGGARRPRVPVRNMSPRPSPRHKMAKNNKNKSPSPSGGKSRSMNLNCCNGSPREVSKSPGPEYQLMRPREDSNSGNLSSDVFENIFRKENSSGGSDSIAEQNYLNVPDNNNHEYINVTEEMITELQRIRNNSSTSESSTTPSYEKKEPMEIEKMDNVRLDPEGSESKEKPTYAKMDSLLKSASKVKGCQCKNPNCSDRGSPRHSPKHAKDAAFLLEPGDTLDGRESWVSGTGRSLSPQLFLPVSQKILNKRDQFQKSNSFDYDSRLGVNVCRQGVSSSSMPLLGPGSAEDDSELLAARQSCQACSSSQKINYIGQNLNSPNSGSANENEVDATVRSDSSSPFQSLTSCHMLPSPTSTCSSSGPASPVISLIDSSNGNFLASVPQEKFHTHVILDASVPKVILQSTDTANCEEAKV